tara:strand:+ start:614 stop:1528 length:915 start_codon:yes stop_codon:yes gene_type:complete
MVLSGVMKEIKKFCKDDDTCIFIILVLIGFLLCMFFNRDEGFLNYAFIDDPHSLGNSEDLHQYGPSDGDDKFGKAPTQVVKPTQPIEKPVGMIPQDPGPPHNGYAGINEQVAMAKQGKQYQMDPLPSRGKINRIDSSLDRGPMGVEMGYKSFMPWAQFGGPPSDMGLDKPMGEPQGQQQVQPQAQVPGDQVAPIGPSGPSSKKEMKLVLFYAPWCGHSKNMLGDYDSVISQYDNKDMNGVTLSIIKIDMDKNSEGAKEYNVEVKGFPTLYTFVEVDGKLVGQPFSPRDEKSIVAELEKRTQSLN